MTTIKIEQDITEEIRAAIEDHPQLTKGGKGLTGAHFMIDRSLPGGHRLRGNCNVWVAPAKGSDLERKMHELQADRDRGEGKGNVQDATPIAKAG